MTLVLFTLLVRRVFAGTVAKLATTARSVLSHPRVEKGKAARREKRRVESLLGTVAEKAENRKEKAKAARRATRARTKESRRAKPRPSTKDERLTTKSLSK